MTNHPVPSNTAPWQIVGSLSDYHVHCECEEQPKTAETLEKRQESSCRVEVARVLNGVMLELFAVQDFSWIQ
jgi:hypothetical protein